MKAVGLVLAASLLPNAAQQHRSARDCPLNGEALKCQADFQVTAGARNDDWWAPSSLKQAFPHSSTVITGIKDTVPTSQTWSRCEYCALELSKDVLGAVLFDPRDRLPTTLNNGTTLSSSKWLGFFHERTEVIRARRTRSRFRVNDANLVLPDGCSRVVSRPVYIFSVLTWQTGHLLVDVLEPLFHTMQSQYGRVPAELRPVLILEVANQAEQRVLLEKLVSSVWEDNTPFSLLSLFSDRRPIYTTDALRSLLSVDSSAGGLTCFADLHLGLDISRSYYANGFDRHGSWGDSSLDFPHLGELRLNYKAFQHWLWASMGWGTPTAVSRSGDTTEHVVLIRRLKTRQVVNSAELTRTVSSHYQNSTFREVALEEMSFREQAKLFRSATIVVSQYGTALHNTLMMRPNTAIVMLMQPYWCDWGWAFGMQASLLDQPVYQYCDEAKHATVYRYRWHQLGWLQGPWFSKDANQVIDADAVRKLLGAVSSRVPPSPAAFRPVAKVIPMHIFGLLHAFTFKPVR